MMCHDIGDSATAGKAMHDLGPEDEGVMEVKQVIASQAQEPGQEGSVPNLQQGLQAMDMDTRKGFFLRGARHDGGVDVDSMTQTDKLAGIVIAYQASAGPAGWESSTDVGDPQCLSQLPVD
jgi:hypothetical protein